MWRYSYTACAEFIMMVQWELLKDRTAIRFKSGKRVKTCFTANHNHLHSH